MEKILLDATIGLALEALLGAVLKARETAHMYVSILAQLEYTIRTITPKISEIDRLSEEDFPDDVIHRIRLQLILGKELVDKCSEPGCCTLWKSQRYLKKLRDLDESLQRLITIDLQVKVALDVVRISNEMKAICRRWDQNQVYVKNESKVLGLQFAGLKRLMRTVQSTPKRVLMNLVRCGLVTE